jgi:hypothetical protein
VLIIFDNFAQVLSSFRAETIKSLKRITSWLRLTTAWQEIKFPWLGFYLKLFQKKARQ